jgi:glycosyltransferase involved in cell wall biosynthesis
MAAVLDVIVPIHNIEDRGHHLRRILATTTPLDTNFIIVSDSELDSDHHLVRKIIEVSPNPSAVFVSGQFGGPGSARNAGISASDSEWICFLDSDDDIDLTKVHSLIYEAEKEYAGIAIGGLILRVQSHLTEKKYFFDSQLSLFENISLTPAFTRMVFRRNILQGLIFPNFRMAEDQCFIFDLFSLEPKVFLREIYFYVYNIGISEQATKNSTSMKDLSKSVMYIFGRLKVSDLQMRQVGITMILRQSWTYFSSLGFRVNLLTFKVLWVVLRSFFSYPVISLRSIFLIKKFRPRVFNE